MLLMAQVLSKHVLAPFLTNSLATCSIAGPGDATSQCWQHWRQQIGIRIEIITVSIGCCLPALQLVVQCAESQNWMDTLTALYAAAVAVDLPDGGLYPVLVYLACNRNSSPKADDCSHLMNATRQFLLAAAIAAGLPVGGKYPVHVGLACNRGCSPKKDSSNYPVFSATWVLHLS